MSANFLAVIMYHYVRDIKRSKFPRIKGLEKSLFAEQLKYFSKNYNFVSVEDVIDSIYNHKKLPPRPLLLTFDDGYIDHYENVFELLLKMKIPGAFYIPSQVIYDRAMLDVNKIHFILASSNDDKKLVEDIFYNIDRLRSIYSLDSNITYFDRYKELGYRLDTQEVRFIKKILQVGLPPEARREILSILFEQYLDCDEFSFGDDLYVNLNQAKEMYANRMHIGSHGSNHLWLNSLSYAQQLIEIQNSMLLLKDICSDPNYYSICYPYGAFNDDTVSLAREMNFKIGLTTKAEIALATEHEALKMSRLDTNDLPKDSNAIDDIWMQRM